jgi:hypothetical protein
MIEIIVFYKINVNTAYCEHFSQNRILFHSKQC